MAATPDGGGGVSNELTGLLSFLQKKLGGLYFDNPGTPPRDKAFVNLIRLRALFENMPKGTSRDLLLKEQQGKNLVTIHDLIYGLKDSRITEAAEVMFGKPGSGPRVGQGGTPNWEIGTGDGRASARDLVAAQWRSMEKAGGIEAVAPPQTSGGEPTGVLAPERRAGADVDAIRAENQRGLGGAGAGDVTTATDDIITTAPSTGGGGGTTGTTPTDDTLPEAGTPRQIPGGGELWRVDGKAVYLAYTIPDTDKKMVWHVENPDRLKAIFGDQVPAFDKELSRDEFRKASPWRGGLSAELVNTSEDPWQQFMSDFNAAAELRPWLKDPSVQAVMAVAYLEGRAPTSDELSVTDWWNNHTADERAWMEESVTLGRDEVNRRRDDASTQVEEALRKAGMNNVPKHVADYIAEQRLTGKWSETYANEQVRKLSDPWAPGTLDRGLLAMVRNPDIGSTADAKAIAGGKDALKQRIRDIFDNARIDLSKHSDGTTVDPEQRLDRMATEVLSGARSLTDIRQSVDLLAAKTPGGRVGGMDVNIEHEDRVRDLATKWLGPVVGAFDSADVSEWAGRIRNDPDAEQEFIEYLQEQRLSILPGYTNRNLTYENIIQPVRNLATNIWGQHVDDETMLVDLANMGDYTEMAARLRKQGLDNGIGKVVDDALSGLSETALGQQVIRSNV